MSVQLATAAPSAPAPSLRAGNHWAILLACAGVLLLAAMLSLGDQEHQVVVPLIGRPLPPLCTMKLYTGIDCPGCGLTRSFIATAHGQWSDALRFNAAGPLWFALFAAQVPWRLLQIWRIRQGKKPIDSGPWGQGLLYSAMAALLIQWTVRQLGWF